MMRKSLLLQGGIKGTSKAIIRTTFRPYRVFICTVAAKGANRLMTQFLLFLSLPAVFKQQFSKNSKKVLDFLIQIWFNASNEVIH